jgi:lipid-A-disaccharide synthase
MEKPVRIGVVAGELSGDRLGAALIRRVLQRHPKIKFVGIAGPQMRAAGCEVLAEAEELSVMGLIEVLRALPGLVRLRRRIVRYFKAQPPQLFLGIDAPDFNFGLEKGLKRRGIRTLHWVSPSVWAWRRYRLKKMRNSTDCVLTLFPFEASFYRQHQVEARFVGHPLADEIRQADKPQSAREQLGLAPDRPCLALLPGSRKSEIERLLPRFLQTAVLCRRAVPALQFVLPVASPRLRSLCRTWLARPEYTALGIVMVEGRARDAMMAADAVLLASGTATLECMLLERPMVVAYRLHPVSFALVRRLLRVPYVSLPNNLLNQAQVPEFLQSQATPERLSAAVLEILQDPATAARQVAPFAAMRESLGHDAVGQVAELVLQQLAIEG